MNFLSAFNVFRRKPDPQVLVAHARMQALAEVFVRLAVANKARVELYSLRSACQGRDVSYQVIRHPGAAQESLGNLPAGLINSVDADAGRTVVPHAGKSPGFVQIDAAENRFQHP